MAFKEEKSGAIVIGTNPGFQNGVLIVDELSKGNNTEPLGLAGESGNG